MSWACEQDDGILLPNALKQFAPASLEWQLGQTIVEDEKVKRGWLEFSDSLQQEPAPFRCTTCVEIVSKHSLWMPDSSR